MKGRDVIARNPTAYKPHSALYIYLNQPLRHLLSFSCSLRFIVQGFVFLQKRKARFKDQNGVLQNDIDLLNPPAELEKRKHKLKRLVQSPNSFFMDVKCQGCFNITTVFSHSQTVVVCGNCQTVLCQPTGGRAKLTEGCSFRKKSE
ncbi:40S ribosomal protein S27-2 [Populus alba x Populus x berolinensis]|nr:40S ribosomal protein S27-2 [Populus alba x Populus x berolinensis]